jgi:hydrophobe/amphiphile efflux-3 (HAE3) family protein
VETFWRRTGVRLGKYWYAVLALIVAITGLLSFGLRQLDFATGQDSYLNPDSQIALDNVEFQEDFGGEAIVVLFRGAEGRDVSDLFEGDNLEQLRRVEQELREIPEVYAVVSPLTSLTWSDRIVGEGVGTDALLSALEREPTEEGKAARQADIEVTLARLAGVPADERVLDNPAWIDFLLFDNTGFTVDDGTVVAPPDDERTVRLSLRSTFADLDTAVGGVLIEGNADLDELSAGTDAAVEIMASAELDGFEIVTTGSPVYLGAINDYLQGGMLTLGAAALLLMAVVLLLMFRVRWRLLPLLAVLIGVVWAFAILGLVGIDLSLVTISGLPILIGVGIDFAIQVHNRVEEEVVLDRQAHPMSETLSNLAPPLIAATISGVLAFLALQISQVPMLRDFGVMLAIGIVVLLVMGIVLPTAILGIREYRVPTSHRGTSRVERVVVRLGSAPQWTVIPMVIGSIALFIGGIALEGNFSIESDPQKWIDQDSQTIADVETLQGDTGFSTTLGILVEANNVLAQPVADVVHEFTLDAEDRDEVVTSSSLAGTVSKLIAVPGATRVPPRDVDLQAAAEVLPADIERVLLAEDRTRTQINLRLAEAGLEERAVLVAGLERRLDELIEEADVPADSILLEALPEGTPPMRAVPSGLAVVGIGLLENLSANRATLTYLGLALAALWLLIRFRSLSRALLTLVPIGLAVGTSSVVVAVFDITLSPITTVSGPLVIAACTEFSVLIMGRYLEERQRGLDAQQASDEAAGRTGRAFFTSAVTTICGFAVLIGSALPLLRDFGIIVTLNVAVALVAALVVMPPLLVWADGRDLLRTGENAPDRAVVLAARNHGVRQVLWIGSVLVVAAIAVALYGTAEREDGEVIDLAYAARALPTTTTTIAPPEDEGEIDPATYGDEPSPGLITETLFRLLTAQGAAPNQAVCTGDVLVSRVSEQELLALGIADFAPAAVEPVVEAAQDCGVDQAVIDATVAAGLG